MLSDYITSIIYKVYDPANKLSYKTFFFQIMRLTNT